MNDWLSPALRERGFAGSRGSYGLRCHRCWALLSLQKSVSGTAAEVKFTVNLAVINKNTWTKAREEWPHLPERPSSANLSYGIGAPTERLGKLTPQAADKWWLVGSGVELEAVAEEIASLIDRFGLPWLSHQMDQQGCNESQAG
ncbi:DUF4304 domain-containing protein [Actinoplanes cyaneus]|uniref:DUF4304 domain-containing protein n=1 Tax=Actinoplanes cyaneus TaxID=52696 RepID=UPI001EF1D3A1|nr:DUF4304 domain-containing protein [Actinoplanes cyaneus]